MTTIRETYLDRLTQEFKNMIDLMLNQIDMVWALLRGESADDLMEKVKANEDRIDELQVKLRDDIINSIVLQSPRAGDLRRIIAYYDAIVDVERTADLLYSIVKRMHYMQKDGSVFPLYKDDAIAMFKIADKMVQNAVFAFFHEDKEIAHTVINSDEELDVLHRVSYKKLFTQEQNETTYPHLIADLLDLGRIFYGIERIGDCATNIAESVIFLTEGVDVKHWKK